ncbi:DinB family protein [Flavobacterium sp. 5]|uniref:DinB family protein n=1 Tax=Flavobacterium sp. 5 TaxID=2035199 RepID=UPI000C2CC78F|nr:DinB family protein [Flavobacterium sp. 5]PKB15100.1 DinB family protein [Flavobacterium sp. 5]
MKFTIDKSIEILTSTPFVLKANLNQLSSEWLHNNEGENTWSPFEIVIHLINGEKTNWLPRIHIILSENKEKSLESFIRMDDIDYYKERSISELLNEFKERRNQNINDLKAMQIDDDDLNKTAIHPVFGTVKLSQLIATWTLHDLNHLSQISRVLAKQYKEEVGPWKEYLPILGK